MENQCEAIRERRSRCFNTDRVKLAESWQPCSGIEPDHHSEFVFAEATGDAFQD